MDYLGIPSISAGHNPHIAFEFAHTARSREEYARLIEDYRSLRDSPEKMRRESLEFYCMHNLRSDTQQRSLRELILGFRALVNDNGGTLREAAELLTFAKRLEADPAYQQACAELAALLRDTRAGNPAPAREALVLGQVASG
jgi:hypothetical protein